MPGEGILNEGRGRAQAATEYIVIYGFAILVIVTVIVLLYNVFATSRNVVPNSCQFSSTISCADMIVVTNTVTGGTYAQVFLINSGEYPITNPALIVSVNNVNSSVRNCQPSYVKTGGLIVCNDTLGQVSSPQLNQLLQGGLYLYAAQCGLSTSPAQCKKPQTLTYVGNFAGYVQTSAPATELAITLVPQTYTPSSNLQRYWLHALVTINGQPMSGAVVNFSANGIATVSPKYADTNTTGGATSYINSTTYNSFKVYANLSISGLFANVIVTFSSTTSLTTTTNGGDGGGGGYASKPLSVGP